MNHIDVTGGTGGRRRRVLHLAAAVLVLVAACGSTGDGPAIPWSADPCGLASPRAVGEAFGLDPVSVAGAPAGECRYRVGDTLLRVVVLADGDGCDGTMRSSSALGATLTHADGARRGVFVSDPGGDVVVCDAEVTYLLSAAGKTDALLSLVEPPPAERRD